MKLKKRFTLFVSVLLAFALLLAGCSESSGGSGESSDGKKTTLRVLVWGNGPEELKGEEEIYAKFEEENPNINVELIHAPYDQVMDKFVTMSAGGDQPDLVWLQSAYLPGFAEQGLLMKLDDLIEKAGINKEDWLPGGVEMGTWDETIYALPRDIISHHIVYNKDMFDKAGVPYPQDGWTWDDYVETAKKLTIEENGKIVQFGSASYSWEEALVENGAAKFSQDGSEVLVDSPEAIEAIQWAADLSNVHHVSPTATESQGLGDLFLAGKAAMAFTGPWNWRPYTTEGKFNWDIVEVPAGKAGNKSQLLGLPIAIGANTEHPEEAWTLLEYLTHGGGQEIQSEIVGAYPSVKSATEKFSEGEYAPANVDTVHQAMEENTVVTPNFPTYSEAMNTLQPVIDQIMNGEVKAEDALPKVADKIRSQLNMK
ncbi:sugar ABC transporter substrate-binding protein [uncultured Metabacillus sp.]|uniref:ABC transporter substrate-binding protein n=1 Tax=Metabacillus sp. Hm71 TaxID=3450743 RepID=UPI00262FE4DB|nr:sugar ABC transporter substrate-binding protein [uncultured Metabacillus sp.]